MGGVISNNHFLNFKIIWGEVNSEIKVITVNINTLKYKIKYQIL